jgi:hypothetical protein
MAKTWTEKYNNGKEPFVAPSIRKVSGFPPGSMMLIPIPAQVDGYIRSIPPGEDRTIEQMSKSLARAAGADLTCPMCCGMFLRICAEKAFEELGSGTTAERITPFWRMVTPKSPLRKKLSFGTELVDTMRAAESTGVSRTSGQEAPASSPSATT